jgi:hypothetical protein
MGPRSGVALVSIERVDDLKRDIALSQYEVDAHAVAEAILAKLQLVRSGRLALLTGGDAGQNHAPSRPPARDR